MRILILVACLWLATSTLDAKIVFRSRRDGEGAQIYTMNSDGSHQTRITHDPTNAMSPAWSSNGRQIVFDSERGSKEGQTDINVWVIDADGKNLRQLTFHPGAWDDYPYWSPDGTQIAFSSDRLSQEGKPPKYEMYVMAPDGSNIKQVTDVGFASQARWSPDGEWILFEGIIDQVRHIYAIRPDGTDLWQVSAPLPERAMYLGGWSPDGKRIVYAAAFHARVTNVKMIIASVHPSRRAKVFKREVVPLPKMSGLATVSFGADGKSILFAGRRFGNWDIYRFRLDTHELIQLTDALRGDMGPREWNPRLSVSPRRETLPQTWGRMKAVALSK